MGHEEDRRFKELTGQEPGMVAAQETASTSKPESTRDSPRSFVVTHTSQQIAYFAGRIDGLGSAFNPKVLRSMLSQLEPDQHARVSMAAVVEHVKLQAVEAVRQTENTILPLLFAEISANGFSLTEYRITGFNGHSISVEPIERVAA
jgi:hypothetical protein